MTKEFDIDDPFRIAQEDFALNLLAGFVAEPPAYNRDPEKLLVVCDHLRTFMRPAIEGVARRNLARTELVHEQLTGEELSLPGRQGFEKWFDLDASDEESETAYFLGTGLRDPSSAQVVVTIGGEPDETHQTAFVSRHPSADTSLWLGEIGLCADRDWARIASADVGFSLRRSEYSAYLTCEGELDPAKLQAEERIIYDGHYEAGLMYYEMRQCLEALAKAAGLVRP